MCIISVEGLNGVLSTKISCINKANLTFSRMRKKKKRQCSLHRCVKYIPPSAWVHHDKTELYTRVVERAVCSAQTLQNVMAMKMNLLVFSRNEFLGLLMCCRYVLPYMRWFPVMVQPQSPRLSSPGSFHHGKVLSAPSSSPPSSSAVDLTSKKWV